FGTAQRHIPFCIEAVFLVFNEVKLVRYRVFCIIFFRVEYGVRRRKLSAEHKVGAAPGEDLLIHGRTGQRQLHADVIGSTVIKAGYIKIVIVLQLILLVVQRVDQRKVVVRPFQLLTQGNGGAHYFKVGILAGSGTIYIFIVRARVLVAAAEAHGELVLLFTSQPGLRKGEVIRAVGPAVGRYPHGQLLTIAAGQRVPAFLAEDIAQGKVVERYAQRTGKTDITAPAGRQLQLVIGFFFHGIVNIHGTVLYVG